MLYKLSTNKTIVIPDKEIKNYMEKLELSQADAVELWLEDNDYNFNEEQDALDRKAKTKGLDFVMADKKTPVKTVKTHKTSKEKIALFESILKNIDRCDLVKRENVRIIKENKMLEVKIGDKTFKIDIIENRKPKK